MQYIYSDKKRLTPSKIVCVGRNYAAHIEELNNETPSEPIIFIKPNSAIANHLCVHSQDQVHYETEISFVIENNTLAAVGLGLDLTKRQIQDKLKRKGLPWERAKAFNQSAVFSEFVSLTSLDVEQLCLRLFINDKLVQEGGVSLMLYKPHELLTEITSFMSLEDGDILMTGTPSGVGIVKLNDQFRAQLLYKEQVLIDTNWQAQA
jgi:2-keto-4-pentenoate hydratase/2-oxohepta-3-ene-1,7-dioic acid hydratase in catechol pathway